MLTVKGVAKRAGVSAGLVYDWISSGRLAHFRLGKQGRRGSIRIDEADLDTFLRTLKRGGEQRGHAPAARRFPTQRFKHLDVRRPTRGSAGP